jgi:hypothetical protein
MQETNLKDSTFSTPFNIKAPVKLLVNFIAFKCPREDCSTDLVIRDEDREKLTQALKQSIKLSGNIGKQS